IKAEHQRTSRAIGPQAHVGTKDEAVHGNRIEGADQALPQAHEEFLIIQRALDALGLPTLRKAEDQVDIRGEIQLMSAELAHAEDHHLLRLATAPADGGAELLAVTRVEPAVGQVDAGVGQVRQIATGLLEGGLATDVTPDDAQL